MSANSPVTVGEKSARDWAANLDIAPIGIVHRIADLREDYERASAAAEKARQEWDRASNSATLLRDRIEALKHRLVSEL